jgi:hypothetical protein
VSERTANGRHTWNFSRVFFEGGTVGENPTAIFYISQRGKYREFTNGKVPKIKGTSKKQKS